MFITIAWTADIRIPLKQAELTDDAAALRKLQHAVEAGNRVWESWLLRRGGQILASLGPTGSARVKGEHLDELSDIKRQYSETVGCPVSVGCGMDTTQAQQACEVATIRGGDSIVLYTEDIHKELETLSDERDLLSADDEAPAPPIEPVQKNQLGIAAPAQAGEATKIATGKLSRPHSNMNRLDALGDEHLEGGHHRTTLSVGPSSGTSGPPAPEQPSPEEDLNRLKQGVVGVLKQADQIVPVLEQLKQEQPEVYEVVNSSVQAMIEMAKVLFGQQQAVQKSEETPGEGHGPEETSSAEDMAKDELHTTVSHLNLPVGSVHNGKIKVKHQDGTVGWVQARSGMVRSPSDGHAISAKSPESK